ncbi:MAG: ferrochelatase [FCB group bacterium]|jgi:ferrochelatase|nr:ferrochelatase [FCB group bacterium]
MQPGERVGILLLNTGTTAAPRTKETREYLREFLSDPRVIDIAPWARWLLVNLIILPFRPRKSAEAYAAIWTERGSPLLAISLDQREGLKQRFPDAEIEVGMGYGKPSIKEALQKLVDKRVDRIIVAPLFPQYASASSGAVMEAAYRAAAERWNVPPISALPAFYDDPGFLDAWATVAVPPLAEFKPDHVLFSYHGLPERQVRKSDPTGHHCLATPNCCDTPVPANRNCYRAQCFATTRALVQRLGLAEGAYTVSFQSRLGRDPWLQPATDQVVTELPTRGAKRLAVLCPAFITDCLETLEEIGLRARESFIEAGGEEFRLVPCLNDNPVWLDALANLLRKL